MKSDRSYNSINASYLKVDADAFTSYFTINKIEPMIINKEYCIRKNVIIIHTGVEVIHIIV
jgi:hypothetical protein